MQLVVTKMNIGLWAAAYIKNKITTLQPTAGKPFVLGLPTGNTVLDMYAILRTFIKERVLNFQSVITFNLDEYVGMPSSHPQSYYSYMKNNLFEAAHMPPTHTFLPNGQATDLKAECARYETAIAKQGGIDLLIGGIGQNGHIAFNEPGTPFHSRTHVVTLTSSTREANAHFFHNDITRVPKQAITLGIGTILDAKELLFLACGVKKAVAVSHLVEQEPSLDWPLTALHLHPRATLLADLDACVLLSGTIKNQLDEAQKDQPHAQQWVIPLEVPA